MTAGKPALAAVVLASLLGQGAPRAQDEAAPESLAEDPVERLWEEFTLPDSEVGRAVRQGLPLTPEQIGKILALLSQYRETVARESRPVPEIVSREITLSLRAGESAPAVSTQMGYPTSVVFIDATGEPWPVESLVVEEAFGPSEESPGGHVVYVTPAQRFLHGSALVQLHSLSMPVVLELRPGKGRVDGRLVVRVSRAGPNADPIAVERAEAFGPGDPVISAFLHGHAPPQAQRIEVRGGNGRDRAWWLEDAIYLRTAKTLLAPQAQAWERGANGDIVYRIADTPYALVSADGARVRLTFGRRDG